MLECLMCHKQLKQITSNHLKRHQMTIADYRARFVGASLQDESIIMRGEQNPFFGRHHTDELKRWQSEHFTGKKNPTAATRISKLWEDPNGVYRKMMRSVTYRETMSEALTMWWSTASDEQIRARFEAMRKTNESNGYWIPDSELEPFDRYRRQVRRLTQINFRKNVASIPNAHLRGKGHDLDHVLSIFDGFMLNVPAELVAHPMNLVVVESRVNKVKGRRSAKSVDELARQVSDVSR